MSEVAVSGRLSIDRAAQVQLVDDTLGGEIEVFGNQLDYSALGNPVRLRLGIGQDRERLAFSDSVRDLEFAPLGQTCGYNIFSNVAHHVSSRAVYFRRVFAAEATASVPRHAAVRIDDDLPSGQTRIRTRTADGEAACGIYEILGILIQKFRRECRLDDVFENILENSSL